MLLPCCCWSFLARGPPCRPHPLRSSREGTRWTFCFGRRISHVIRCACVTAGGPAAGGARGLLGNPVPAFDADCRWHCHSLCGPRPCPCPYSPDLCGGRMEHQHKWTLGCTPGRRGPGWHSPPSVCTTLCTHMHTTHDACRMRAHRVLPLLSCLLPLSVPQSRSHCVRVRSAEPRLGQKSGGLSFPACTVPASKLSTRASSCHPC